MSTLSLLCFSSAGWDYLSPFFFGPQVGRYGLLSGSSSLEEPPEDSEQMSSTWHMEELPRDHPFSSCPPHPPPGPLDGSGTVDSSSSWGTAWFLALLHGRFTRKGIHALPLWSPCHLQVSKFCAKVPGIELQRVEDLDKGPVLNFQPHVQAPHISSFLTDIREGHGCGFYPLVLVHSFCLTPAGMDPYSRSKQELSLPPLGHQSDHFFQVAVDWCEKEALSSQPSSFPSGPFSNSCFHLPGAGTLFLSKSAMLPRLKVLSLESIKSEYSAHCKVADMALVQNLFLFLLDSAEAIAKDPPLHNL